MSEPFHIVHCVECEGRGYISTRMRLTDGTEREVFRSCMKCEGTGHHVLPFRFEVILEAESVLPEREDESDDGVSQG